jgi:Gpi18-like mannosyltransferase
MPSPRIPFTCSYLRGKANIHFVFWACVMIVIQLLYEAAKFESESLYHPIRFILVILFLAIVAIGMRWLTEVRMGSADELLFEEEYPAELVSLKPN